MSQSVASIVTNSEYTAQRIMSAYGRPAQPLNLGVSCEFKPDDRPTTPSHLLSVGSLIPSKGHDLAIDAVARSAVDLPLVVVGPRRNPAEESRLLDRASAMGVDLRIRVGVADSELAWLYKSALVTLYLARMEPLGLVSLEAQSCGCPVIVADEGGLPETIQGSDCGWAVARTAALVSEAIRRLVDAPQDALDAALGARADEVRAGHTWERSARAVEGRLRALVDGDP